MKYSIIVLLNFLPVALWAQELREVEHVISKDYLALVRDSTAKGKKGHGAIYNNIGSSLLRLQKPFLSGTEIRRIQMSDSSLSLLPVIYRRLSIGGNYNASIAFKTINRQPALQSQYAQGRSINGELAWQGPETSEPFSYGPGIGLLEFDGSVYPYDKNGRLVPLGTGDGNRAKQYDNGIFRTGTTFSQSFHIYGEYFRNNRKTISADLKVGHVNENTVIKNNENNSRNLSADLSYFVKWLSVKGRYSYLEDRFSNYNRNGFLNRLYQSSLLTPATFDNNQGATLGNGQRSYSNTADNPLFLLDNNGNFFKRKQHNAGLTFLRSGEDFNFKLIQSIEKISENSSEGYKPGTVSFPDGIAVLRNKADQTWLTHMNVFHKIWGSSSNWRGGLSANYIFTDARSDISYATPAAKYNYQRSSHEVLLSHITRHYGRGSIQAQLETGNRFYFSNTAISNKYFQPALSGSIVFLNVFYQGQIKLTGAYNQFNSELPVNRSLAHANLLRYSTAQASQFLPFPELTGFDHLDPIQHREWSAAVSLAYSIATLTATAFVRDSRQDIFPVYNNGRLELQNMANHRNKGIEIVLNLGNQYYRELNWSADLSFFAYQDMVTQVRDGHNFTPVAGFSNVYKAIVKGESIGAIVGNSYRRDADRNIVIGRDGYPLVDNEMKVIGNAIPDWVAKWSQRWNWKWFILNIDLEWKKGGDIWNGTQAMLDYYGRSENSAVLRNTKDYVFNGVLENGRPNNIPVDFYDPAAPFSQNRWVRYGPGGVAEAYIQRADHLRINTIQFGHEWRFRGLIRKLILAGYVNNLMLWTAYKGVDPNQLLYDQPNTTGLDFFNLPSAKTFGCNVSIQF